jgi:hypothetical protein
LCWIERADGASGDSDGKGTTRVSALRRLIGRAVLKQKCSVTTSGREVVKEDLTLLSTVPGPLELLERNVDHAVTKIGGESLVHLSLDTNVGGDLVVLHHQQDLGQGVDTGSGLGVTDVGLDGTKVDGLVSLPLAVAGSEDIGDRGHLNTVTGLSTSTVHLNVADLVSINTSVSEDLLVKELLCTSVRVSDGYSFSGVVGSGTKNATKDVVLIVDGILVTLEDDSTASITTAVSISVVVVGLARAGLGQELTLGKTGENVRVGQDIEATSASSVTVASPQGSAGELNGSERRRASSVDGVRRA